MRKLKLRFGEGLDSVVYSPKNNRLYSYEIDNKVLHNEYGGVLYYTSRDGLSGVGWVEEKDLIPFGVYTRERQEKKVVHLYKNRPIFGYVPIIPHKEINLLLPIVLTDGECVAFTDNYSFRSVLLNWQEVRDNSEHLAINYFLPGKTGGEPCSFTKNYYLYNPEKYQGVRASRFIDLTPEQKKTRDVLEISTNETGSIFYETLNIVKCKEKWYHLSEDRIFDKYWSEDPYELTRKTEGPVVDDWFSTGKNIFWKRDKNIVSTFIEIPRKEYANGKYWAEGLPEKAHYSKTYCSQDFSISGWLRHTHTCEEGLISNLFKKIKQDYVKFIAGNSRHNEKILTLMENNPDIVITIKDSLKAGNCGLGVYNFISEYKLEPPVAIIDLLAHEKIDSMIDNYGFCKTIIGKIVDPDNEYPDLPF
ncbi:MAG: hypothetical protein M0Q14_12020 [Tissierellaceae bacterium]|nr:hypothetical protein [Tissierellaceae bacterium]